jgi:hypothetical protein
MDIGLKGLGAAEAAAAVNPRTATIRWRILPVMRVSFEKVWQLKLHQRNSQSLPSQASVDQKYLRIPQPAQAGFVFL